MEVSTKVTLTPEQVQQACEEFVLRKILGQECIVTPILPPEPEAPSYDIGSLVTFVVPVNPYRVESERWRRFSLFQVGETLQMAKSQGAHKRDIDHALQKGYIRIASSTGVVTDIPAPF